MYLLDDGRIMMYAMGEYFLLEKNESIAIDDLNFNLKTW